MQNDNGNIESGGVMSFWDHDSPCIGSHTWTEWGERWDSFDPPWDGMPCDCGATKYDHLEVLLVRLDKLLSNIEEVQIRRLSQDKLAQQTESFFKSGLT